MSIFDFQEERNRLKNLYPRMQLRSKLLQLTRDWFCSQDFLEMSIPKISPCLSGEPGISAVPVFLKNSVGKKYDAYLLPSPEIHLKKLVGSGYERIYELGWSYRDGEPFDSKFHNGEFFLLEWYRTGPSYRRVMEDVCKLICYLVTNLGGDVKNWKYNDVIFDLTVPRYLSLQEAFLRYAQIDLNSLSSWEDLRNFSFETEKEQKIEDIFYGLYAQYIDSNLGKESLDIVYGFPNFAGGFSRENEVDHRYANRFEVYLGGMELANGYDELCETQLVQDCVDRYRVDVPVDKNFVRSLQDVENVSGVALGWDRLFMFLSEAKTIQDVLLFSYRNLFNMG